MPDPEDDPPPLRRPEPPRSWRERVEEVADATGTTPVRLAVGAMVALAALVGAWWLLRPPPEPVEVSLPYASTVPGPSTSSAPPSTAAEVVVDVVGAVVSPGLHALPPGARVADAVDAAGGLGPDADRARLNLAAPLVDGERIYVPAVGEPDPPAVVGGSGPPSGGEGPGTGGPLDLNTADAAALEALPGVGPSTAAAIIRHRAEIGRFASVDQLLDVPGIGEAKLEALRELVVV